MGNIITEHRVVQLMMQFDAECLSCLKSMLLVFVKFVNPDARFVFIAPPSWEVLVSRLVGRGTEDPAEQERRLRTAKVELAAADEFDVTIVNDDLELAVHELAHVMGLE